MESFSLVGTACVLRVCYLIFTLSFCFATTESEQKHLFSAVGWCFHFGWMRMHTKTQCLHNNTQQAILGFRPPKWVWIYGVVDVVFRHFNAKLMLYFPWVWWRRCDKEYSEKSVSRTLSSLSGRMGAENFFSIYLIVSFEQRLLLSRNRSPIFFFCGTWAMYVVRIGIYL